MSSTDKLNLWSTGESPCFRSSTLPDRFWVLRILHRTSVILHWWERQVTLILATTQSLWEPLSIWTWQDELKYGRLHPRTRYRLPHRTPSLKRHQTRGSLCSNLIQCFLWNSGERWCNLTVKASISTTSTDQQCHRPNGPPTVNLAAKVNDNDNDNEFV